MEVSDNGVGQTGAESAPGGMAVGVDGAIDAVLTPDKDHIVYAVAVELDRPRVVDLTSQVAGQVGPFPARAVGSIDPAGRG